MNVCTSPRTIGMLLRAEAVIKMTKNILNYIPLKPAIISNQNTNCILFTCKYSNSHFWTWICSHCPYHSHLHLNLLVVCPLFSVKSVVEIQRILDACNHWLHSQNILLIFSSERPIRVVQKWVIFCLYWLVEQCHWKYTWNIQKKSSF